jgi:MoxR-like ATPase
MTTASMDGAANFEVAATIARLRSAVANAVVGNEAALNQLLVALMCQGHALLEDVPGVGKTLLARSLAQALGCEFRRIQLTPDVLPSDITGSNVYNQQTAAFEFRPGPVFTQVLLADEINRATPRCQSALLEAMEERQVTIDGTTRQLPEPFFVLATQNPIELEGTFPLPEAQIDRFALRITLGYPELSDEHEILRRYEQTGPRVVAAVTEPSSIMRLQEARGNVAVSDDVRAYLIDLVRSKRNDDRLVLGASPRAALALHRAVQAHALLVGRSYALPDDVKAFARPVLAHRLVLATSARLRGATAEGVLDELISLLPVPVEDEDTTAASAAR